MVSLYLALSQWCFAVVKNIQELLTKKGNDGHTKKVLMAIAWTSATNLVEVFAYVLIRIGNIIENMQT